MYYKFQHFERKSAEAKVYVFKSDKKDYNKWIQRGSYEEKYMFLLQF